MLSLSFYSLLVESGAEERGGAAKWNGRRGEREREVVKKKQEKKTWVSFFARRRRPLLRFARYLHLSLSPLSFSFVCPPIRNRHERRGCLSSLCRPRRQREPRLRRGKEKTGEEEKEEGAFQSISPPSSWPIEQLGEICETPFFSSREPL